VVFFTSSITAYVCVSRTPGRLQITEPISSHVGHARLDQVVEAARHQVAFEDLRAHLHRRLEGLHHVRRRAVEHHLDEDHHSRAELVGVQSRLVAEDEAVARQPLHPLQHGGRRQVHRLGELQVRDAPILLQRAQDAGIDLVERGRQAVVAFHGE
jgi:hypothetical protein